MKKTSSLAERISNQLEQHRHNLVDRQQQLDSRMKEMLEQRERLAAIAKSRVETVVHPRMEEPQR